jgi:predicted Zn-dependent protease
MTSAWEEAPLEELAHDLGKFLSTRSAQEVVLQVRRSTSHHGRMGANELSSCGTEHAVIARINVFHEGRSATASTTSLCPDDLRATMRRAAEIAAASPVNPEYVPPPEPWTTNQQGVCEFDGAGADTLLPEIGKALTLAKDSGVLLSGFLQVTKDEDLVCSSRGSRLTYRESSASLSLTARTRSGLGSGKARWSGDRLSDLNISTVADEAIRLARASEHRIELAPSTYPTILAPAAAADLLGILISKMQRRPADEGRSAFSRPHGKNALGDTCLSPNLSLASDPCSQDLPCRPFSSLGEPLARTDWISRGTVASLQTDRYWASKVSAPFIPSPLNFIVSGSNLSLDEVVAKTEHGLLVHHLWYIRLVDEQSIALTGLTRDGVFLVKEGKISAAVNNLRFNDSPLRIFAGPLVLGRSVRTESNEVEDLKMLCPAISVPALRYTATSDAV